MPFLTDVDSRAAVKGSRDPLGLVPVWSRFGRFVVGNLTTVSNSVRGFTTLLLGYYFAETVLERDGAEGQSPLSIFLKFEQLAGYARWHFNQDDDFRGRDRVVLRLDNGAKITIGADAANQILANQKIYGLWGLFSVPARQSGLLAPEEPILTPEAREFVERQYVSRLTADGFRDGKAVVDLLRRERADVYLNGRDASLARSLAKILSPALSSIERSFYDRHLVDGGDVDRTRGCQPLLAELLAELPPKAPFTMDGLRAVVKRARRRPSGQLLTERLVAIEKVEELLVPMESAFGFLLSRDGQALGSVAGEIRKSWGRSLKYVDPASIDGLRPVIGAAFRDDKDVAERFVRLARAFSSGDYEDALRLLLDHNGYVMQARNGSRPWALLEKGKLDVRYRDESGALEPREELERPWRNTYFINSLKDVVSTVRAG